MNTTPIPAISILLRLWAACLFLAFATPGYAQAAKPKELPEVKRTMAGLYLEAREVPTFIEQQGGARKILFIDVRTRAEAMFVGMINTVDALVPFVELQDLMTDWDGQRSAYKLEPMQEFVTEVGSRLQQKGLLKTDTVVLICRSGDRSSRAANRLLEAGYSRVFTVVDGFEGDMSPDGRRSVNGWKNSGLPWGYKLEKTKMYFPR
jgi:rhodanese-related sulfurtransferase